MGKVGFHSAASGVYAFQDAMNVTANNISNVNTTGFKTSRASFSDLIYTQKGTDNDVEYGHGSRMAKTDLMFSQGQVVETGKPTDFAAMEEGFFAIETSLNGEIRYTKDGEFYLSAMEDGTYQLCDSSDGYVLDYDGNRITVPYIEDTTLLDEATLHDLVGVYSFENPYGLDPAGNNYYEATLSSGEAVANREAEKVQGFTERSGTDLATEMSKVIEFQRAFQLNINMLKTQNELGTLVNNLQN